MEDSPILEFILGRYNYWLVIVLMMVGLYVVVARGNLVKKLVGLNLFQVSVFLFYISVGKVSGGTAPIYVDDPNALYSNPLPHVLILTAIVVGVATLAVGLSLVIRIQRAYGTIEEDDIQVADAGRDVSPRAGGESGTSASGGAA
ncbi:PH adaptation potassium efflux system protein C; sodium-potassium/hydrogen antiporter subunit C [Candidatus Phaeomarinobacter ectocarpi]|uniref:PH adaptation potassium efflux system protein C sodium-potassium/hydrogen antiporter subunit C n=1 Tax=Candidatus Phaeomarinibacter ectocarpi TaxID=1458461 RepID=X5MPC3_9HYPH|nr:cation:proton antiporter subunit C [Candidatus Phaeomarinobacter ectocarpi]CDO61286.1 PH adaptation potassium efflux system protein C; sodium-potassium/hydrogen antiporter subunit C [Candidatus Phaeomarinobacter ectocarpi]